jgi:hypothetical protein
LWIGGSLAKNYTALTNVFPGLAAGIKTAVAAAGPWLIVGGLIAGVAVGISQVIRGTTGTFKVYAQNLMKLTDAQLANASQLLLAKQGYDGFKTSIRNVASESVTTAQKMVEGADLSEKAKAKLHAIIEKEASAQQRAAAAAGADQAAYSALNGTVNETTDALTKAHDALSTLANDQLGAEGAALNLEAATARYNETLAANGAESL